MEMQEHDGNSFTHGRSCPLPRFRKGYMIVGDMIMDKRKRTNQFISLFFSGPNGLFLAAAGRSTRNGRVYRKGEDRVGNKNV